MLEIKVQGKCISTIQTAIFVRGTVGEKVEISCDEEWGNRLKTVVFKRLGSCAEPIVHYIGAVSKTEIDIPHEILHESGQFYIGLYSVMGSETTPTLWSEAFNIEYGTDTNGVAPKPPTPSVYSEIVRIAEEACYSAQSAIQSADNAIKTANSVRQDADEGVFNGEKGDKGDNYILTEADKTDIAKKIVSPNITFENGSLILTETEMKTEAEILNGTLALK